MADTAASQLTAPACVPAEGVIKVWRTAGVSSEASVITVPADANKAHKLHWLSVYFTGANPSAVAVTVAVGSDTLYSAPLGTTQLIEFFREWSCGLYGAANAAMVITVPDPTTGVPVLQAGIE